MSFKRSFKWNRALLGFLLLWLLCTVYFLFYTLSKNGEQEVTLKTQVEAMQMKLRKVDKENYELRLLLKEVQERSAARRSKDDLDGHEGPGGKFDKVISLLVDGPKKEYEVARRQTERDTNEFWWFIRGHLEKMMQKEHSEDLKKRLGFILKTSNHRHKTILSDLRKLAEEDGYQSWRHQEAKGLSDLVQARLHALQNPSDCTNAKKLYCNLNKGCGYGCQIHHAIYCFIVAYGTERMLVLKSKGWRYDKAGFEDVFLPLSDTCPINAVAKKVAWPGKPDSNTIELGIIDSVSPKPKFVPPSIPRDLADRIIRLHGNPIVWWVSQFLKYLLRPQPELESMLKASEETQGFAHPIVGIHVRRTDKVGTEAAFHGVEEYMKYVEEYYLALDVKNGGPTEVKRVFVATDDPKVLKECKDKFPQYEFLGDMTISKSAAVSSRYNLNSLQGIITDIHMLSLTDYLVCTFSSQVCRIAYEIMQEFQSDAADKFKSLDDVWYFGGQDEHQQVAIMKHDAEFKQEMDMKVGDVLGVAGNHWNGFNKGKNHRTSRVGLYPEYKTQEVIKIEDFPTYPHVKL